MKIGIPIEFEQKNMTVFNRLQERYKRIITSNTAHIKHKNILDLASNNGRWSYAALGAGAKHVVGVEGRKEKIKESIGIFNELNVDKSKWDFENGDIFDYLQEYKDFRVDTIFCLGIFYHIMDHHRLLMLMARTKASTIIIDSAFVRSFRNSVHVQLEDPSAHRNALPKFRSQKSEFAGFVSLGLMIQMSWNLGFTCRPISWSPADLSDKLSVQDYMMGRRFTLRLERTDSNSDPEWVEHWYSALVELNPRFANLFNKENHDLAVDDRVRRPFNSMEFSIL